MYKEKGSEGRGRREMVYPLEMIPFHARHTVSSSLLFSCTALSSPVCFTGCNGNGVGG